MPQAVAMGFHTLVGYGREPFPRDSGNCFSVGLTPIPKDTSLLDKWYVERLRVVNVHYENFAELQYRKLISFPIEIEMIGEHHCAIVDKRVPPEWMLTRPCRSCVPQGLMEEAQRYCRRTDV